MKNTLVIFITFIATVPVFAQVVRDHRTSKPARPPVATGPVLTINKPQVTVYEHANYQGQSKSFGPGMHVLTGFNDITSSVKVSPGLVVMIYEHNNDEGGYGNYTDLMEDCPDLTVYNLNDRISYINVFAAEKSGTYVWARARNVNNNPVPGHWERKRASGALPDNAPPAIVLNLYDADDMSNAPPATQAEIEEFDQVVSHQLGVGVLGGHTTHPFYYHHNQPGEEVYKYNKIIDPGRLPGAFFDWASDKLGRAGIILKPFQTVTDFIDDIKDWIFGSGSNKVAMDCWYPVTEFRKTVCGKMTKDALICTQDYLHTQVTVDKDVCFHVTPSEPYRQMLTNRWTGETSTDIEGEVKSKNLWNLNTQTGKSTETTTPRNPLLLQYKKDENVCMYGAWMGDILDLNMNVPIPLTDEKIELGNIDLRKNNEIHPINQLWKKNGKETQLIAIVDGTGYFKKAGNGEVAASGLNQQMRFYLAFMLPANPKTILQSAALTYDINGIGFDFTLNPPQEIQPETITLRNQGTVRVKVNAHTFLRQQKTFRVFFDKVRKRPNGSVQGYIVVETEYMTREGGSVNIFVKDQTPDTSPAGPIRTVPVRTIQ